MCNLHEEATQYPNRIRANSNYTPRFLGIAGYNCGLRRIFYFKIFETSVISFSMSVSDTSSA
jgi:hypothetical protein